MSQTDDALVSSGDGSPHSQRVLVVGAGPVGHILAAGLTAAGFRLRHWSRSSGPLWEEKVRKQAVDVVILAVRDDAIAQAARFIVEHGAADRTTVLLHCAGALPPLEVLAEQAPHVKGCGLLHPLRSFADGAETITPQAGEELRKSGLHGTVMAIGGDEPGLEMAKLLCEALGGVALPLSPEQQGAYHAAAVMAAGHVAALLEVAVHVLTNIGLHRPAAERALAALTRSVTYNIEQIGLPGALTGPFSRGDADTVARHLKALSGLSAEAEAVYRGLGPSSLDLGYRKRAATPESLDRIAEILFKRKEP